MQTPLWRRESHRRGSLQGGVCACVYNMVLSGLGIGVESISWLAYYSLLFISLGVMALYDLKRIHTFRFHFWWLPRTMCSYDGYEVAS